MSHNEGDGKSGYMDIVILISECGANMCLSMIVFTINNIAKCFLRLYIVYNYINMLYFSSHSLHLQSTNVMTKCVPDDVESIQVSKD